MPPNDLHARPFVERRGGGRAPAPQSLVFSLLWRPYPPLIRPLSLVRECVGLANLGHDAQQICWLPFCARSRGPRTTYNQLKEKRLTRSWPFLFSSEQNIYFLGKGRMTTERPRWPRSPDREKVARCAHAGAVRLCNRPSVLLLLLLAAARGADLLFIRDNQISFSLVLLAWVYFLRVLLCRSLFFSMRG